MANIGLLSYFLDIEVKQIEDGMFISREGYARKILKKFKMCDCLLVSTPLKCGIKSPNMKLEKRRTQQEIDWKFTLLNMHETGFFIWGCTCRLLYVCTSYNSLRPPKWFSDISQVRLIMDVYSIHLLTNSNSWDIV